jgi:hypothetical protein
MKWIIPATIAIILWAAFIVINESVDPLNTPKFLAATVLTLAVVIQRISSVQRWLATPKNRRKEQVDVLAQQVLLNLCMGKTVSTDLQTLCVHVWEIPAWYRRLISYRLRRTFKSIVRRNPFRTFTRWSIRPALKRVAAVGLVKQAPSGIRFRKGVGLVGVCVFNNDRAQIVTLRTSSTAYRRALLSDDEDQWRQHPPILTHNLSLEDAKKLSHSYGQVIAKVIQEPATGEAIGCVTISLRNASSHAIQIAKDQKFRDQLNDLSMSVASILA